MCEKITKNPKGALLSYMVDNSIVEYQRIKDRVIKTQSPEDIKKINDENNEALKKADLEIKEMLKG